MMEVLGRLATVIVICAFTFLSLPAQTVIAFQGGEGSPADNWTFQSITNAGGAIPPGIVPVFPRTGSFAIRAGGGNTAGCSSGANCIAAGGATGCPMHGNTIQFDPINTSCLSGVVLTVYHRAHTFCSGDGFDATDNLNFEVRLNGGAWTTIQTMATTGDYVWSYATNPAGIPATVPNPWVYNVPVGTTSFEFRVRATVNRSDEVFYLDDVSLTTTTTGYSFPGIAGLWNGLSDDNWFNACNWDSRTVPTGATNVSFPTTSANDIVIQAGQNCACNNLTCAGPAGHRIHATASPAKVLTVNGNLNINTTAGSTVLNFSDAAFGTPDGTINLGGNWNNNSSAGDFVEGESTVNFVGAANQTITLATVEPTENFFNLTVNKPGGDLMLAKSTQAQGILTLQNGKVTTAANAMIVSNPLPISVTGHSTASYVNGNMVRAIQTGAGTRVYDYPLGTAANYELATLSLTNPTGFTAIGGFFNPVIGGFTPNITEAGYLYNDILNAGVWTLSPDAPFIGTYDITLAERGYTNGGALSYINVKRPDAASFWSNPGTHVSFSEVAGVVTCTRSGLTAFSDFAIALSNNPLAANEIALTATLLDGDRANIDWTWMDADLGGTFTLVRTYAGQSTEIGHWEIGAQQSLSAEDQNLPEGLIRYELRHLDRNGMESIVATDELWNGGSDRAPKLWPNPNHGFAHLQLSGKQAWSLALIRIDGAVVAEWSGDGAAVEAAFEQAVGSIAPGVYVLDCRQDGRAYHLKMVKD
ncbi:MAG: hypothetical protein U0176_13325 [Bacteroidia bacterium]